MPKKKEASVLGLPPLPPPSSTFTDTGLIAYTPNKVINQREQAIWENLHEDKVVIAGISDKAKFGMEEMNGLKWFAAGDVGFTMLQIEEVRHEANGTEYQGAMDEFCKYLTTLSARHSLGVIEVSTSQIAMVVGESMLPPPPPPAPEPKKGFLARLLGG